MKSSFLLSCIKLLVTQSNQIRKFYVPFDKFYTIYPELNSGNQILAFLIRTGPIGRSPSFVMKNVSHQSQRIKTGSPSGDSTYAPKIKLKCRASGVGVSGSVNSQP